MPDQRTLPVRHLRAYSNYLSPMLGLLSADTWTLVAIIGRNLILNWTVLFPLLAALLLIPRLCVSFVRLNLSDSYKSELLTILLLLAFVAGIVSIAFMGIFRPSLNKYRKPAYRAVAGQAGFLKWCLFPTLLMAILLSTYWGWLRNADIPIHDQLSPISNST